MKVLIVGAGKLGYRLANALLSGETQITVMDIDPDALEYMTDHLDVMVVKASGLQVNVLKEMNIDTYDLLIAVAGSDETNILVCSIAKQLGCKRTIARIRNPEYATQQDFIKSLMGIDYVVNPELATANEIIRYLLKSYTFYSGDFAEGRILMVDYIASNLPGFAGKKIKELDNISGLLIVAISRDGRIIIPNGESLIMDDDIIYLMGKKENISQLAKTVKKPHNPGQIKKVMILGGGKISYYLAQKLISLGIAVKIIERDRERCQYLSENLENALVIYGDGTDINLLKDEDIGSMDAFVGATGLDEENVMMTLMAKHAGVKKVIAKVSRPSYINIIENLGVDSALSPTDITASNILKFIRGGRAVSVSLLLGGQAEVTEIIADESMPVVGRPIVELGLPKGVIIGAIAHNGKAFIPSGSSVIYPGDRFVVFCTESETATLEAFFKPAKGGWLSELWNRNKNAGKPADD